MLRTVLTLALLAGSAYGAQSGEILGCEQNHPNYAECQRQLERQQRGAPLAPKEPDRQKAQRDLANLQELELQSLLSRDPFEIACNLQHPLANECQRRRIDAMYDINMQRAAATPSLPPRVPAVAMQCSHDQQKYAECERAKQRYQQAMVSITNAQTQRRIEAQRAAAERQRAAAEQERLAQERMRDLNRQQEMRNAVRDGVTDAARNCRVLGGC